MSDRPPNDTNNLSGGWRKPDAANQWQGETVAVSPMQRVRALPLEDDLGGGWHLPQLQDTTYSASDEVDIIAVDERPVVNTAAAPVIQRPEDILKELTQSTSRASYPRPEDAVPRYDRTTTTDEDEFTDTDDEELLDGMEGLEALGALDDADDIVEDDDEAFSMSEMMALASLGEAERDGLDQFDKQDMSPAQRALFEQASAVADEMETDSQAAATGATMPMQDTTSMDADTNDAADYARRMAQQYAGDDTGMGQQTEYVDTSQAEQLSPQEQELAQKLREARRQVRVLRQTYENGEIDYTTLRTQLQNYNVLDENSGAWWSFGSENNVWYRYDANTGQWVESQPPVPVDAGAPRTETGQLDPNDVIAGSMPYLPDDGSQQATVETSSDYDPNDYNTAQSRYSDQYAAGDTPVPYPDQPAVDSNATIVGDYFDADTLPHAAETVQGMNYVDDDYYQSQPTVPAGAIYDQPASTDYSEQSYQDNYTYDPGAPQFDQQAQPSTTYSAYAEDQRANFGRIALFSLVGVIALAVIGGIVFFFAMMNWYNNTTEPFAPTIASLATEPTDFQNARILDANGDLIREILSGDGAREIVTLEAGEISPYMVHAIVSREDESFFENSGVAFVSIFRAFVQNYREGDVVSGASTITQQIVKNAIINEQAGTSAEKAREIAVALEVADQYEKTELLNIYLNLVPFGNQTFGVQAAAEFYFDVDAADLNMAQAAMLAGLLSSPEATNPVVNREAAFDNMRATIDRMIAVGCLDFQHGAWAAEGVEFCINNNSTFELPSGENVDLYTRNAQGEFGGILSLWIGEVVSKEYQRRSNDQEYPFFVRDVISEIEAVYGPGALTNRGLVVQTTLIPRIQDRAESAVEFQVDRFSTNNVNNGAAIVINPTNGHIVAQVGSPDFNAEGGQVDNTQRFHQPGSAIKPILYAAALDPNGTGRTVSPAEVLWDVPTDYSVGNGQTYTPTNFNSNTFVGPVPLRFALQQSLNVPAVDALNRIVGADDFLNTAINMGVQFDPNNSTISLASALGANETTLLSLSSAYAAIANDGVYIEPYRIIEIRDSDGNILPLPPRAANRQGIAPQAAYLLQNILSDHPARENAFGQFGAALSGSSFTSGNGTSSLPNQGVVAAKTGTSNGARDLLTIGFTNDFVVGVWFGELNNNPTTGNLSAVQVAAPAWQAIMQEAIRPQIEQNTIQAFTNPNNILRNTVCRLTGTLADNPPSCSPRYTEFYWDAYPPEPSSEGFVRPVTVDSWTQLLYSQTQCPENPVERRFADIENTSAINWLNNTQQGRGILNSLGIQAPLVPPPTQTCSQSFPTVNINSPQPNANISEQVNVVGIVDVPDGTLQSWQLLLARADNTNNFTPLTDSRIDETSAGTTLYTWETRATSNGTYVLRLEARSNAGGVIQVDVPVTINNIIPTPTLIPTNTPEVIQPGFTPIPFDTPSGSG